MVFSAQPTIDFVVFSVLPGIRFNLSENHCDKHAVFLVQMKGAPSLEP